MTATGERMSEFMQSLGFSSFGREVVDVLRWRAGGHPPAARPPRRLPPRTSPQPPKDHPPGASVTPRRAPVCARRNRDHAVDGEDAARAAARGRFPLLGPQDRNRTTVVARGGRPAGPLSRGTAPDFAKIQRLALEHVQKGFGAPEAVLLTLDSDHRNYVATLGHGRLIRYIRGDRAVRRDERTVFGICLGRRENVVIHNTTDPRIAPYLPAWCSGKNGLGAFVAMPCTIANSASPSSSSAGWNRARSSSRQSTANCCTRCSCW